MKKYTVYYVIKANRTGYLRKMEIEAKNQREAVSSVRNTVRMNTGRNTFWATCKAPHETDKGLEWHNGNLFTRWDNHTRTLW